jgi:hypothetical protein
MMEPEVVDRKGNYVCLKQDGLYIYTFFTHLPKRGDRGWKQTRRDAWEDLMDELLERGKKIQI